MAVLGIGARRLVGAPCRQQGRSRQAQIRAWVSSPSCHAANRHGQVRGADCEYMMKACGRFLESSGRSCLEPVWLWAAGARACPGS